MPPKTGWMLCYDVVVCRVGDKDVRRKGRQAFTDSFAPDFGDPVAALMLADTMNESYGEGTHWIEDEAGTQLHRVDYAMAIEARRAAAARVQQQAREEVETPEP